MDKASSARPHLPRWFILAVVAITVAGGTLRACFLDHPMRYDESMAYVKYVVMPLVEVATRYDNVQNHILHTMLVHEVVRWWGNSPSVLRSPAMAAGILLIPLAIGLAYATTRHKAVSLLAGGLVASSTVLIDYSSNSRGYTMVCVFTLGMCLCTVLLIQTFHVRHGGRTLQKPRGRGLWLLWAVLAVLGGFTVPIMALPIAGLAAVIALDALLSQQPKPRRRQLGRLLVMLATTAILTGLLYVPALMHTGTDQFFGVRHCVSNYSRVAVGTWLEMASTTWNHWTQDVPLIGLMIAGVGLAAGLWRAVRRRNVIWAMPLILAVTGGVALWCLPMTPYPRVWLYLLPVVLTFAACGLATLRWQVVRRLATVGMVVGIIISGYLASRRESLLAEDPHTLLDAESIMRSFAGMDDRTFAVVSCPSTYALRYYTWRYDLPRPAHPTDPRVCSTYVVVNHTQTLDEVLSVKGEALHDYGPARLYKTLPHCSVYRMDRDQSLSRIVHHAPRIDR